MNAKPSNENAPCGQAEGTLKTSNQPNNSTAIGARELRLMCLFLQRPGGVTRREAEPVVGTTYLPNLIKTLREGYLLNIPCKLQTTRDRDGKACTFGRYVPSPEALQKMKLSVGAAQ